MARTVAPTLHSNMLRYLQGWIGVVGLMALGNTISCFAGHQFLSDRLYTAAPSQVNGLTARLFGIWTLLSAILRLYCSAHICNIQIYNLTFLSFVLAFGHFILEIFVYKTTTIDTVGVIAPLLVSGISMVWMIFGYKCIQNSPATNREEIPKKHGLHEMIAKHNKDHR